MTSRSARPLRVAAAALAAASALAAGAVAVPASAAPRWGPEELVTDQPPVEEEAIRVATNRRGVAFAAWMQEVDGATYLFGSRRGPAGAWSDPDRLSEPVSRYAGWDLAVGPRSGASAVWHRPVDGTLQIEEAHWADGAWTSGRRVRAGNTPSVVLDGTGRTTIAWRRAGLRVLSRPEGGAWRPGVRLGRGRTAEFDLGGNSAGVTALVWETPTAVGSTVRGAVRRPGEGWDVSGPLMVRTDVQSMRTSVGPGGRALLVWTTANEWDEGARVYRNGVAWSRTTPQGAWPAGRYLTRTLGEDGGQLALSTNAAGEALATWYAGGGGQAWSRIDTARFGPAVGWSARSAVARRWFDHRPWLDDAGVARVVGGSARVRLFTQRGNGSWVVGESVSEGTFGDADGAVERLVLLTFTNAGLGARVLDVE